MPMHPNQLMLFGQSVEGALPEDSDVRVFAEMMGYLDYSSLESKYSDLGCPAYPPDILAKVLAYAYSNGIRSSRKIEEVLLVDVRFIWLAGGLKPDHNTLARFRKGSGGELKGLFKDSVKLCMRAGLVFLNSVSTDGTKIVAAASRKRIYDNERVEREMKRVEKILQEAEEADRAEDETFGSGNGREMPEDLKDAHSRKAKLNEIARELQESKSKNVVSSDPECRVMKTRSHGKCPAYNLQASVDAETQIIVAMELTQSENDIGYLPSMTAQIEENTGMSPDISLADTGYCDEATLKWIEESKHDVLMPPKEQPQEANRNDLFASKCFVKDDKRDVLICPAGRELKFTSEQRMGSGNYRQYSCSGCKNCSFHRQCCGNKSNRRISISVVAHIRQEMCDRLKTKEGKEQYSLRQETAEPVFGQMKSNKGFIRLLLHGRAGAIAETALMCMVHNITKCVSHAEKRPAKRRFLAIIALITKSVMYFIIGRPKMMIYTSNGRPINCGALEF
jgi:transposase